MENDIWPFHEIVNFFKHLKMFKKCLKDPIEDKKSLKEKKEKKVQIH